MRPELKPVIAIFLGWFILASILMVTLPAEWKWIAWLPIGLIILALVISGIGIVLMRLSLFSLKPLTVIVDGKVVTACMFCPQVRIQENPVNKNFPVYKCPCKVMRTIYSPGKVQRWCGYVGK